MKGFISTIIAAIFFLNNAPAQDSSSHTATPTALYRIAILAPLYIDSAFSDTTLKLNSPLNIPKYFLPGLDFYNGVMLAIDSLQKENMPLEVWVFDTKKASGLQSIVHEMEAVQLNLIIASFTNAAEQKIFSDYSFNNSIPLLSATYPNNSSVAGNPFFIILNSTLKTHVEALYRYIGHNYPVDNIYFITRKGTMEKTIQSYFDKAAALNAPLQYKTILLPDNFTAENLLPQLDSTKKNVLVCGTLNENFALQLIKILSAAPQYNPVAIGMPTWDGIKSFSGSDCNNVELVFSTPFKYVRTDSTTLTITKLYSEKYSGRANDMVFKGFEVMYHFAKLLTKYPQDLINHLSDSSFHISNTFRFLPERMNSNSYVPDYMENKNLYFKKQLNGVIISFN